MTSMVEKVALAIWQARLATKDGVETFNHLAAREEWVGCARAAIQAMREPTEEMSMEARDSICVWSGDELRDEFREDIYRTMIDAALKEE